MAEEYLSLYRVIQAVLYCTRHDPNLNPQFGSDVLENDKDNVTQYSIKPMSIALSFLIL